jgi:hypothetical protein
VKITRQRCWTAAALGATTATAITVLLHTPAPPTPPAPTTQPPAPEPTPAERRRPTTVNGRIQPALTQVPTQASGHYAIAPGTTAPPPGHPGPTIRYLVEVERGLPFDPTQFATAVHQTLNDPRGWGPRFQRVSHGPHNLRVSLSSPTLARQRCLPLHVGLELSCWQHGRAIINAQRWGQGAHPYGRDLATYREYLISHEVGHALGHHHLTCPAPGKPAPTMVQQTKSLYGCRPNPWPHRSALAR